MRTQRTFFVSVLVTVNSKAIVVFVPTTCGTTDALQEVIEASAGVKTPGGNTRLIKSTRASAAFPHCTLNRIMPRAP
jgi:hypothetical protein